MLESRSAFATRAAASAESGFAPVTEESSPAQSANRFTRSAWVPRSVKKVTFARPSIHEIIPSPGMAEVLVPKELGIGQSGRKDPPIPRKDLCAIIQRFGISHGDETPRFGRCQDPGPRGTSGVPALRPEGLPGAGREIQDQWRQPGQRAIQRARISPRGVQNRERVPNPCHRQAFPRRRRIIACLSSGSSTTFACRNLSL